MRKKEILIASAVTLLVVAANREKTNYGLNGRSLVNPKEGRIRSASIVTVIISLSSLLIAWSGLQTANSNLANVQRAFLYPSEGVGSLLVRQNGQAQYSPFWINSGSTQATAFIETHCVWNDTPLADPMEPLRQRNLKGQVVKRIFGPHQKQLGSSCFVPLEQLHRTSIFGPHLYLMTFASYKDAFGHMHRTETCNAVINAGVDPEHIEGRIGFDALACDRHNCLDDDCKP